jgi:hypothetical protein
VLPDHQVMQQADMIDDCGRETLVLKVLPKCAGFEVLDVHIGSATNLTCLLIIHNPRR